MIFTRAIRGGDRRERRGKNGFWDWGREKSAVFDSSRWEQLFPHFVIATKSLTALSVTHPAELIKHAGWTLYSTESTMLPSSHPQYWEVSSLKPRSGWEENHGWKENEKCSPLSSYEIDVNVPSVVEFKTHRGSSELLTCIFKKHKHGYG